MNCLKKSTLVLSFCCISQLSIGQKLVINELSQSNIDEVMTDSNFPESWVELYNPSDNDVDLRNYRMGIVDEYSESKALRGTVPAHGYAIIYCDVAWSEGHFPYRLESDARGSLFLFTGKKKVDEVYYPAMLAPGVAYGRTIDGGTTWMHEIEATPGATNNMGFSELLLPEPIFSIAGGIKSSELTLKVTVPPGEWPSDARIYYTIDGSEPTKKSTSAKSLSLQISHTTVVRAKVISSEALSRRSTTQSYIFLERPTNLPVFSIAIDDKYLNGDLGIYTHYTTHWRRPINVECYDPINSSVLFNQLSETALSGGGSRKFAQKSMKCYAKKWFGTKRFHGVFWKDKSNVNKNKSFILRNGGNNSSTSKINDAFVQKLFGNHLQSLDWQAYEPAIVYINGEYKGLFEWRERSNDDYVYSNYDGLEAIESAEANLYTSKTPPDLFKAFREVYCTQSASYEDLDKLMDIDNFMDALIAEMYSANTDYPHNNVFMWRPTASGGRWRWILKDLDYMARNDVNFDMFTRMFKSADGSINYENGVVSPGNYTVYRKMISLPQFRERFIQHFAVYLGDFMKPSYSIMLLDQMTSEIKNEILATQDVYEYKESSWISGTNKIKKYCEQRPGVLYNQMADFFSLGSVIPMKLENNGKEIKINDIPLTEGDFDGSYFSDYPLSISTGASNYGWRMTVTKSDGKTQKYDFEKQTVSLKLGDYGSMASVSFEPLLLGQSDFERMLAETGLQKSMKEDYTKSTVISIPEPSCAYANLTGLDVLPSSKDDVKNAYLEVYDGHGNYFKKKILVSLQGGESSNQYKKNFAVGFCEDEWIGDETPDITFGDWVKQDEFHLKGFYNDYFRGIPAIGYKLYNQMLQTHSAGEQYAWQRGLSASDLSNESLNIYSEARCFPDAFPCVLYFNGDYYGTFAWQLKKQRRNMNQTKDIATHIHLDGTLNDKQLFQGLVNWTKFEVRNPKDLYNMDGSDYDGDDPQELIDASSPAYTGKKKMSRCAEVKQHILDLSQYYNEINSLVESGASVDKIKERISRRFDVTGLIDYLVLSLVTSNYDGFSKRWQWFTYDADKWFVAPYDLDLTFGYNEEYQELWPASQSSKKYDYRMENVDTNGPMYWIKQYYWDEVKLRYSVLRDSGVLTTTNIMSIVNDWYSRVGDVNRSQEWLRWPESPCLTNFTDSPNRMKEWISNRLSLEDDYLGYTPGNGSYTFSMNAGEWATLCLPFSYSVPNGLTFYTIEGVKSDGVTLRLAKESHPSANKPYLVHGSAGQYELAGTTVNTSGPLENGLLVGTFAEVYAPAESYVLQHNNGVMGFYHVPADVKMPVGSYHAYLKISGSHPSTFRIDESSASCEEIHIAGDEAYTIYNPWGQRIDRLQTGIGIVRYPNGQTRIIELK